MPSVTMIKNRCLGLAPTTLSKLNSYFRSFKELCSSMDNTMPLLHQNPTRRVVMQARSFLGSSENQQWVLVKLLRSMDWIPCLNFERLQLVGITRSLSFNLLNYASLKNWLGLQCLKFRMPYGANEGHDMPIHCTCCFQITVNTLMPGIQYQHQ